MKMNKIEMPEDGCGLSEICPRCGNGYIVTSVSIAGQSMDVCDLCANEIIDKINERPDRAGRMTEVEGIKLKQCPFCDSDKLVFGYEEDGSCCIRCTNCGAQVGHYQDYMSDNEDIAGLWNRREKE